MNVGTADERARRDEPANRKRQPVSQVQASETRLPDYYARTTANHAAEDGTGKHIHSLHADYAAGLLSVCCCGARARII